MSNGKQDINRDSTASLDPPNIPESQLTRMDPDSILADDADPEGLLGNDSESEAGMVGGGGGGGGGVGTEGQDATDSAKRISAASAIFSTELDRIDNRAGQDPPKTPDVATQGSAVFPTAQETPRQAALDPVAASNHPQKVSQLEAQVIDLNNQVTGLNGKLVRSFERISDLEDDLSDSQERVKAMSAKIAELEKERQQHLAALNTGLLVEKAHVSSEMQRMMDRVIEETAQRGKAESDKQRIESELDELSSSLFNEANKMVAVERLARARAEEKSKQMEERLKDTEGIMLDQQKVLADLQRQVEKQQSSRNTEDDVASSPTKDSDTVSIHRLKASSLARTASQRTTKRSNHARAGTPLSNEVRILVNIVPYQEFRAFVAHLRKLRKQLAPFYNYPLPGASGSEAQASPVQESPRTSSSASHAGGFSPQTSLATYTGAATAYSQGYSAAVSTNSPFAASGLSRHRDYPSLPSNVETMVHLPSQLSLPFVKRSQEEDVDPCLRLDFAPGLNWLTRRQANTAILEGNLVIEPIFPGGKPPDEDVVRRENMHLLPAACSLCGIPVVNVPLPGVGAANPMAAEQGGKNSLVPASIATATTNWASSAANSLREVTGTSISSSGREASGALSHKSSRPSLFSSFRRSTGGSKGTASSPVAGEPGSPGGSGVSSEEPLGQALQPSLMETSLPVPTHIFRISEGASSRYLLCPHHCLTRLRAACQYWGFVRTMERSVVLEGKFAADEPANEPLKAPSTTETPSASATASGKDGVHLAKENTEVDSTMDAVATADSESGVGDGADRPKDGSSSAKSESHAPEEIHEPKEAEEAQEGADDPSATSAQLEDEAHSERTAGESTSKDAATSLDAPDSTLGGDGGSDGEDGFADAISSPGARAKETQDVDKSSEVDRRDVDEDQVDTPLARSVIDLNTTASGSNDSEQGKVGNQLDGTSPAPGSSSEQVQATGDLIASGSTAEKPSAPPPVPRRSAARGPVANSPAPLDPTSAPSLPPRRTSRTANGASSSTTAVAKQTLPPAKLTLDLSGSDAIDWEDKMWTEITRLKEELWKARVGLVVETD